jgi:hypothetical protein
MERYRCEKQIKLPFLSHFCTTTHLFIKTGSGQTQEAVEKKGVSPQENVLSIAYPDGFTCGAKNAPLSHLYIQMPSFYQDRLGTNIGKTPKKKAFCAGEMHRGMQLIDTVRRRTRYFLLSVSIQK